MPYRIYLFSYEIMTLNINLMTLFQSLIINYIVISLEFQEFS